MSIASFLNSFYTTISQNENFETTTVIWLDDKLSKSKKQETIQRKLRTVVHQIKVFTNLEECKKYIEHVVRDDRIVLITTGKIGKDFIPHIYHCQQIVSIYIFCMDAKRHETWTKNFLKIKGIFTNLDGIIRNLSSDQTKRIHTKIDEPLSINIFTTRNNLDQSTTVLNLKFIYHNLFLDSLLHMKSTSKDKHELMIRCYEFYKNNPSELSIIHEFDQTYQSDQAVWWYTRETFLYRLLNKALRIQNLDLLYFFRFFIFDIEKQLKEYQCQQRIEIYRAQLMSIEELHELNNSVGDYISINSFFSTSKDRDYALFLLGDLRTNHGDLQKILFQIVADPQHFGVKSFADISSKSYFTNECEVLFMLGSIFRLDNITSIEENIWIIDLSLASCEDYQLKSRINQIRQDNHDEQHTDLFSFGKFLHQINQLDEAEKYFRHLLKQLSNDFNQTSLCCYHIGRVYSKRENYKDAIQWYEKSLKIMMQHFTTDKSNVAQCYNSLANIYRREENYEQALDFYQKALEIWKEEFGEDHSKIAICLINISVIHDVKENYKDALECLEKALIIKQKYQGMNHSDIAILYNNIGLVHQHCHRFDLALENFLHALDIHRTSVCEKNIEYAITLENISYLYEKIEKWKLALIYLEEAASIYRHLLSSEHLKIIEIEQNIRDISLLID